MADTPTATLVLNGESISMDNLIGEIVRTSVATPTGTAYLWVNALKNNAGTGIGTSTTCP